MGVDSIYLVFWLTVLMVGMLEDSTENYVDQYFGACNLLLLSIGVLS